MIPLTMLKSLSGHTIVGGGHVAKYLLEGNGKGKKTAKVPEGGDRNILEYLDKDERALGVDLFNFAPNATDDNWGEIMDGTRAEAGNDLPWNGRVATTYRHFVISPDPKDNVSLEKLRGLVARWVEVHFSNPDGKGVYQVAAVYHDDNAKRIQHAHVIVNNTNVLNARRLHFNKKDIAYLASSLQNISRELGLTAFAVDEVEVDGQVRGFSQSRKTTQKRYRTKAERELDAKGIRPWKDDIRDYITVACNLSKEGTIEDFREQLLLLGVRSEFRKEGEDLLFFYPGSDTRKVSGERLGRLYTLDGIQDQMTLSFYRRMFATTSDPEGLRSLIADVRTVRMLRKD